MTARSAPTEWPQDDWPPDDWIPNDEAVMEPQAHATQPLPEAPVSITLRGTWRGYDVLVTLRGTTFARVRGEVEAACQWLEAQTHGPQASAPTPVAAAPPRTNGQAPVCEWHGAMKPSPRAPGTWYCPNKLGDGSWCKNKA